MGVLFEKEPNVPLLVVSITCTAQQGCLSKRRALKLTTQQLLIAALRLACISFDTERQAVRTAAADSQKLYCCLVMECCKLVARDQ